MLTTDTFLKSQPCRVWGCKWERALPPLRMKSQKTAEVFEQEVDQVTSTSPIQPKLFHSLEKSQVWVWRGWHFLNFCIICQVKQIYYIYLLCCWAIALIKPSWGNRSRMNWQYCHVTGVNILCSKYQEVPKQMMQLTSLLNMGFCIKAVSSTAFSPAGGFLCMLWDVTLESPFFALLLPVTGEASGHVPSAAALQHLAASWSMKPPSTSCCHLSWGVFTSTIWEAPALQLHTKNLI